MPWEKDEGMLKESNKKEKFQGEYGCNMLLFSITLLRKVIEGIIYSKVGDWSEPSLYFLDWSCV